MDPRYFDAPAPRAPEGAKLLARGAVRSFVQLAIFAFILVLGALGLASEVDSSAVALVVFAAIGAIYVVFPPLLYHRFLSRQLEALAIGGERVTARVVLVPDEDAPKAAAYEAVYSDDEDTEHVFVALGSASAGASVGEELDVVFDPGSPYAWVIRGEEDAELARYVQHEGRGAFTLVLAIVTLTSIVLGALLLVVLLVSAWG